MAGLGLRACRSSGDPWLAAGFLFVLEPADRDLQVLRLPLRSTSTSTVLPIGVRATILGRPRMVVTSLPSNFMMTSPASRPPLAAGPSGVTAETSAPVFSVTPSVSAMSSVTVWILTPSQPRRVSPNCFNWSMTATTVSEGTAKPMPIEPPVGEMIAVFTPIDLAVHVEQRAAGVALVDGGVRLQVVVVGAGIDVAAAWPR